MKRFSWCKIHHCVDRWIEQRRLRSKLDKIGFKVKGNQLQSELGFRLRSGIISITNRFLTSPPFSFVHFSDTRTTTRIIIISRIFYFSNETRIIPRDIWHVETFHFPSTIIRNRIGSTMKLTSSLFLSNLRREDHSFARLSSRKRVRNVSTFLETSSIISRKAYVSASIQKIFFNNISHVLFVLEKYFREEGKNLSRLFHL